MNPSRISRFLMISAALTVVAALAAIAIRTTKIPIALLWLTAVALLVCWAARSERLRNAGLAVGATLLLVTAADVGLRAFDREAPTDHPADSYGDRGFGRPRAAIEHFSARSIVRETGEVVYDIVYSLDRNGFRLTPGGGTGAETYLFFGDSLTYGEGLHDDETIPAQFARDMGGQVTAVNLGFHGYGPQNMLRLIETDGFASAVTGPVKAAFYLAIADHPNRAAGRHPWNLWSARYVLDANGEPQFTGLFADYPIDRWLTRMELWRGLPRLVSATIRDLRVPQAARVELAAAIVARSARFLAERYHVAPTVLLWDSPDPGDLEAALGRRQISAIRLSQVIGDLERPELRIRPSYENHPAPLSTAG